MPFHYSLQSHWPPLAWLAQWSRSDATITIQHGALVETYADWFGEIVWDGDYTAVGFDQTDIVYGSGGKLTGSGPLFLSSATTVDRLQHHQHAGRCSVSNSLVCLCAALGATVDRLYVNYGRDFGTIIRGIDGSVPALQTSAGPIHFTYYQNLQYRDGAFHAAGKVRAPRTLDSYDHYRNYLQQSLIKLGANARDPARSFPYSLLGTISTGFDSPTVTALARPAGLSEVLTMVRARDGHNDDGSELAVRLGVKVYALDRDAWQKQPFSEVPFLAADAKGEDVYFASASDLLYRRVVLTGFAAGPWARHAHPNLNLHRADQSGLALTEYRLWRGFQNVPVPTMAAIEGAALHRWMKSPEMTPWSSGQKYDKPFCRRVLSEAGIPNALYGNEKKAASILFFDRHTFLSPTSQRDYHEHLAAARRGNIQRSLALTARHARARTVASAYQLAQVSARFASSLIPSQFLKRVA